MKELKPIKVSYDIMGLKPVISISGFDLHYYQIYKKHVDEFNEGVGDSAFNKAGAYLHELYFENIRAARPDNKPIGKAEYIINLRYGSFERFTAALLEQANRLQGNGWIFMNNAGYVNIIPNNRIVENVALIIDLWEHSFLPTYGNDRNKYVEEHLSIINWDIVNKRMLETKKED